jgi:hypothetical protein
MQHYKSDLYIKFVKGYWAFRGAFPITFSMLRKNISNKIIGVALDKLVLIALNL